MMGKVRTSRRVYARKFANSDGSLALRSAPQFTCSRALLALRSTRAGSCQFGSRYARLGFSLIELLVVMAILGLVSALVLTAVQSAREATRRTGCAANLHDLGIAMMSYEDANGVLPPGQFVPPNIGEVGKSFSLHVALLPYMQQSALRIQIEKEAVIAHQKMFDDISAYELVLPNFVCPSDPGTYLYGLMEDPELGEIKPSAATSYHGNRGSGHQKYGRNGVFAVKGISRGMITDGSSNTAAISEVLTGNGTDDELRMIWKSKERLLLPEELDVFAAKCLDPTFREPTRSVWKKGRPWTRGDVPFTLYNHVIAPNNAACTNGTFVQEGAYPPSSNHPGIVNVLYADGHAEVISSSIELRAWRMLGSRDGEGNGT